MDFLFSYRFLACYKRLDDGEHVKSYAVSALVIFSRAFYYLNALNRLCAPIIYLALFCDKRKIILKCFLAREGLNVKHQRFPS